MKAVIPLLFLILISVSFCFAEVADDDFVDPSLQNSNVSNSASDITLDLNSNEALNNQTDTNTSLDLESTNAEQVDLSKEFQEQESSTVNNSFEDNSNIFEHEKIESSSTGDKVTVETHPDFTLPYKQRRSRHGVLFSINYEKYYPLDYFSMLRDGYVEDLIGEEKIPLMGAELGYKLNFKLGSLSILGEFAKGKIEADVKASPKNLDGTDVYPNRITGKREIDLERLGISINFAFDNFFQEPLFVPYAQGGIHQFKVNEKTATASDSSTTQFSFNYKLGLLMQLNWIEKSIDPNTQLDGLRSSGLENTFLDIFYVSHLASSELFDPQDTTSEGDPNMESNSELGVGLKMEF